MNLSVNFNPFSMRSPSRKVAMVQLLYRCWIFSSFLLLATNLGTTDALKCDVLSGNEELADLETCEFDPIHGIGHPNAFVVLDFSKGSPDAINRFFAKANVSTTLNAAIKIVDNPELDTLNFGEITSWQPRLMPPGALAIDIRNNLKLKNITSKMNQFLPMTTDRSLPPILFYNNPLFDPQNVKELIEKIKAFSNKTNSYIQEEINECTFQDPFNSAVYNAPTQNLLNVCKKIKGDLILDSLKITREITLADSGKCLKLTNMDMKNGKILVPKNVAGTGKCQGGPPEIAKNQGLCGKEMEAVLGYFEGTAKPNVELDISSCTTTCDRNAAVHQYVVCNSITDKAEISTWFTDKKLEFKKQHLETATNILTITNSQLKIIDLFKLREARGLEIIGNLLLADLILPLLENVDYFKITGNPLLTVDKFKLLANKEGLVVNKPEKSTIHCYSSPVKDATALRLCTHIKGDLILKGLQSDIKASDAPIKEVDGCLNVEDTQLSNLNFLAKTKFNCQGDHKSNNNPNLCIPTFLTLKTTGAIGKRKCDKTCTSLSERNCVVFSGDLTIDSRTTDDQLKDLTTIQGSLKIDGTNHVTLDFPKLEEISSPTVPALQVSNNAKLETIKMPKITKITVAGGKVPIINILDNPKLKNVDFVPSSQRAACQDPAAAACVYTGAQSTPATNDVPWAIIGGVSAGVLLLLVAVGGVAIWKRKWIKKKLSKKKKDGELSLEKKKGGELSLEKTHTDDEKKINDNAPEYTSTVLAWLDEAMKLVVDFSQESAVAIVDMAAGLANRSLLAIRSGDMPPPGILESPEEKPLELNDEIHLVSQVRSEFLPRFLTNLETLRGKAEERYQQHYQKFHEHPDSVLETFELLHIGGGFRQSFKTSSTIKTVDTVKIVPDPEYKVRPVIRENKRSQPILMEFARHARKDLTSTVRMEVTEYILPEYVLDNFELFLKFPWYKIAELAWDANQPTNLVLHTDKPEIYMMLCMVVKTYGKIRQWTELEYRHKHEFFYVQMHNLFKGAFDLDSYPTHVYYLWLYVTLGYFVNQFNETKWVERKRHELSPFLKLQEKLDNLIKMGIEKMSKLMTEIKTRVEMIAKAKDGEKLVLGKFKGVDVVDTVNKKPKTIMLKLVSNEKDTVSTGIPIYNPMSHYRIYVIDGEHLDPELNVDEATMDPLYLHKGKATSEYTGYYNVEEHRKRIIGYESPGLNKKRQESREDAAKVDSKKESQVNGKDDKEKTEGSKEPTANPSNNETAK